ncbi:MAG: membrane protein insertion efficiency factor YidD [Clostridia bacterium]
MKKIFIFFITLYRKGISPYTLPRCKYTPTCSEYALQAVTQYGAWKGFFMAAWRVLRCNPFSKGGYDPVK